MKTDGRLKHSVKMLARFSDFKLVSENSLFHLCRSQLRSNHFELDFLSVVYWVIYSLAFLQAFAVDVFSSDGLYVGRTSILPQQLQDNYGTLVLTVFSSDLLPMGTITCESCDNKHKST